MMNGHIKKRRINAFISTKNYNDIDEVMKKEDLIAMTLSKGAILDLALSCFFNALNVESIENLAIQHLERIEDDCIDKNLKEQGEYV